MPAPEGAQVSEDGFYWWDDSSQEWKPVDDSGTQSSGGADYSSGQTDGADYSSGQTDGGAQASSDGNVVIPQDVWDDMINYKAHAPELAAMMQYSDGPTYLAAVGLDEPTEGGDHDTAIA